LGAFVFGRKSLPERREMESVPPGGTPARRTGLTTPPRSQRMQAAMRFLLAVSVDFRPILEAQIPQISAGCFLPGRP